MTEDQKNFMREAIKLSVEKMEAGFGGPFGAVVVRNGEIIARGYNNVLATNDPTAHAEVDAIRKACQALGTFQLTDCELYTSCEPCPMCLGAIYWARPRKVYYANSKDDAAAVGFDDQFIYNEIEKDAPDRSIPMEQMMREEAQDAFKRWAGKENKQVY
ncbi:nucleoside deaminase [Pontibacter ramchanderi]|uniref:tRNA(Arg) A34 adenosine deaminase TadA n=1 Tax=Pontibacter ramchanderi TaxID=1179743 RepID=A0A2N3U7J0_9BACT|nr:nucleoside deaminase [Pontibacter ramchanderi]PKV62717.1 tRNA(Arg) A34 adenosine deaminase TadA [Pontibacter ramchanderi]